MRWGVEGSAAGTPVGALEPDQDRHEPGLREEENGRFAMRQTCVQIYTLSWSNYMTMSKLCNVLSEPQYPYL